MTNHTDIAIDVERKALANIGNGPRNERKVAQHFPGFIPDALATAADFEVGQLVSIYSRGLFRLAVIEKIGRKNVTVVYTTQGAIRDAAQYAPNHIPFHDYIYRWQFDNTAPPAFDTQVAQATTSLARALRAWHVPLSVTINGGQHSVLVTGVYTYSASLAAYPASIASVAPSMAPRTKGR